MTDMVSRVFGPLYGLLIIIAYAALVLGALL